MINEGELKREWDKTLTIAKQATEYETCYAILKSIEDYDVKTFLEIGVAGGHIGYFVRRFTKARYIGLDIFSEGDVTWQSLRLSYPAWFLFNSPEPFILYRGSASHYLEYILQRHEVDMAFVDDGHTTHDVFEQGKLCGQYNVKVIAFHDVNNGGVRQGLEEWLALKQGYELYHTTKDPQITYFFKKSL